MQPDAPPFHPIIIETQFSGPARLFALYVLVVLVFSLGRSVRLALHLWHLSRSKRAAFLTSESTAKQAQLLAKFALSNYKLPRELSNPSTDSSSSPAKSKPGLLLHLLPDAVRRFRYTWELCSVGVAAFKKLAKLTLLLSLLTILIDGANIVHNLPGEEAVGASAIIWAATGLLQTLT